MKPTQNPFGDLAPGAQLDGLTVVRRIGEGGMANLYLVHDADSREQVIKVPRQALGTDPVSYVAFENELRLAPYLSDFPFAYMPSTRGGSNAQYLVMAYIPGQDLWSYLKERGTLSEAEAVALARKIVHAVAELHARRIVHLDLKLSNVMLTPAGEVRLVDFGIANHLDLPDLIYESFHEPKGTPAYIAPEQFIGVRDEPRSDVFSMGVMLYEMTTGKLPFPEASSELDVIRRIQRQTISPRVHRPELSSDFEAIVDQCLRPNPDDRFADMPALLAALTALAQPAVVATPSPLLAPAATAPVSRPPSFLRSAGNYLRRVFTRSADHLGRVREWAEQRKLAKGTRPYRILVALDLGDNGARDAMNLEILRQSLRLAQLQPTFITVMTAIQVDIGMASGDKAAEHLNSALVSTRLHINKLLARLGPSDTPIAINVVLGEADDAVRKCVDEYDMQLVVIGCRPKSAFSRFLHGGTGYRILTSVRRSVHVVFFEPQAAVVAQRPPSIAA
jgi:protein-serine/threonine kinase